MAQETAIQRLSKLPGKKLHLGCGTKYTDGWVNADVSKNVKTDVCFDFEDKRWPFEDNEFDVVCSCNVLEHLSDTLSVVKELWRITKPGGLIHINVPYATSLANFRDPTHKSRFSRQTFSYFTNQNEFSFYSDVRFEVKPRMHYFGHPNWLRELNYIIDPILNTLWKIYEMKFAYIFPCDEIEYELRPIKKENQNKD